MFPVWDLFPALAACWIESSEARLAPSCVQQAHDDLPSPHSSGLERSDRNSKLAGGEDLGYFALQAGGRRVRIPSGDCTSCGNHRSSVAERLRTLIDRFPGNLERADNGYREIANCGAFGRIPVRELHARPPG